MIIVLQDLALKQILENPIYKKYTIQLGQQIIIFS